MGRMSGVDKPRDTRVLRIPRGSGRDRVLSLISEAAACLAHGGLVAFPTETVYGLGANVTIPDAVRSIFMAKGRPSDNPLIVHISDKAMVGGLARNIRSYAFSLMDEFWPGPLTLVMDRDPDVPDDVTAGLDSVGIRVPSNPIALALLEKSGVPVAAPSANLSGKPSPTTAEHVIRDLWGKVDWVIDGGDSDVGVESTVLDVRSGIPVILRPGGVTAEDIRGFLGDVAVDPGVDGTSDGPVRSPGMKYRHYSPEAEVGLIMGQEAPMVESITEKLRLAEGNGRSVGLICSEETLMALPEPPKTVLVWGARNDAPGFASKLYKYLRTLDDMGVSLILIEGIPESGIGNAVMNRLIRASGGSIHRV